MPSSVKSTRAGQEITREVLGSVKDVKTLLLPGSLADLGGQWTNILISPAFPGLRQAAFGLQGPVQLLMLRAFSLECMWPLSTLAMYVF